MGFELGSERRARLVDRLSLVISGLAVHATFALAVWQKRNRCMSHVPAEADADTSTDTG